LTACNGCGACCDPVTLSVTQLEVIRAKGVSSRTREWILHDLSPMSRREAKAKAGWLWSRTIGETLIENVMPFFYRCRWFDEESRSCTNYDNRPLPCAGYPWGDQPPRRDAALPPTCSFREDIGKPVEPMPSKWQAVILRKK
jgi:Fe-S-cluster containining protein